MLSVNELSEIIDKVDSLVKMEEMNSLGLHEGVKELSNVAVRELLMSIAHDSMKHAGFYKAISNLLAIKGQALADDEYVKLEKLIRKHIEIEVKMMEEAKKLLDLSKDNRIKHLLNEIYQDEVRHHALMRRLLEEVVRLEAILEEDRWDMLWRDVPGHGAPL